MLKRLTDWLIAVLELLEAEGRSAGAGLIRVGTGLAFAFTGVLLLGLAASVLGWSLFLALRPVWGEAGAAAACGVLILIAGGVLLWLANSRTKKK